MSNEIALVPRWLAALPANVNLARLGITPVGAVLGNGAAHRRRYHRHGSAQKKHRWLRRQEKNGKLNEMPCHSKLEEYLDAYIRAAAIASLATARGRRSNWRIGETSHLLRSLCCAAMSDAWSAAMLLTLEWKRHRRRTFRATRNYRLPDRASHYQSLRPRAFGLR